ncbi:MAG: transposase, partial [Acidobacteriota bacterium]
HQAGNCQHRWVSTFLPITRPHYGAANTVTADRGRVDRMKWKLQTKAGANIYAARKSIVEPVFGQIKHARGYRQFLMRGIEKVKAEWALVCATHNILKMYRLIYG